MTIFRRLSLFFVFALILFSFPLRGNTYDIDDYDAYPIFHTPAVPPNIMVVIDVSGSMQWPAYWPCSYYNCATTSARYDSATDYYGYFETDKYYQYGSNKFVINSACTDTDNIGGSSSCISGNLLNFATMSRIDLLRKAMVGGKATPRVGTPNTFKGEGDRWTMSEPVLNCKFRLTTTGWPNYSHSLTVSDYGGTCPIGSFSTKKVDIDFAGGKRRGIVQNLMDRDDDGNVDDNAPRFGLMVFGGDRYGEIRTGIDGSAFNSFLTALEDEAPYGGTPTGPALYEIIDYFTQVNTYSYERNTAYIQGHGKLQDPMFGYGSSKSAVPCRKNFVLLISDGEYNVGPDPVVPARLGFQYDLRTDAEMTGKQNVEVYSVFAFGDTTNGRNSLRQVAMYGGYDDYDSNTWPYNKTAYPSNSKTVSLPAAPCTVAGTDTGCKEWDKDSDGIPDNYYEADDGNELEDKIMAALLDLLDSSSSGTSASMLSTSYRGAGNVYQSYFLPSRLIDKRELAWTGYFLSIGIDEDGNFVDKNDNTITFEFKESLGNTYVNTVSGDVKIQDWGDYNWDAGNVLKDRVAADRNIISFIDNDQDGIVGSGESIIFSTANLAEITPFLDVDATATPTEVINFVRGTPVSNCRERTFDSLPEDATGKGEWKMGDIVNSTPLVVSNPAEGFHILYSDETYGDFFNTNSPRKNMVYIGANDGMLHAIEADTGKESWAYIPYNLLPHLKWLTKSAYKHVYYVDLKPRVVDLKFSTGWKTVLIGGMRYGGGEIQATNDFDNNSGTADTTRSFKSSYFAIDITDPDNPVILWEFTHADLGFTTSYPAIAKVGDKWFMLVGSGPDSTYPPNYDGESTQNGKLFVLDAVNTAPWVKGTNYWIFDTGTPNAFVGNPTVFDIDFSNKNTVVGGTATYNSEVAYFGETYKAASGDWKGNMWRVAMKGETNPNNWVLNKIFDGSGFSVATPITTAPAVSLDDDDNLWVHFGTGRFLAADDKDTVDIHAFFAIRDSYWNGSWKPCWDKSTELWNADSYCAGTDSIDSTSKLYDPSEVDYVTDSDDTVHFVNGSTKSWTEFLTERMEDSTKRGWYKLFAAGDSGSELGAERSVTRPITISNLSLFTTIIPESGICSYGGTSNLYSLYYRTGTPYTDESIGATNDEVEEKTTLGTGLAAEISLHVGQDKATALVQTSTGEIKQINVELIIKKSGIRSWNME